MCPAVPAGTCCFHLVSSSCLQPLLQKLAALLPRHREGCTLGLRGTECSLLTKSGAGENLLLSKLLCFSGNQISLFRAFCEICMIISSSLQSAFAAELQALGSCFVAPDAAAVAAGEHPSFSFAGAGSRVAVPAAGRVTSQGVCSYTFPHTNMKSICCSN